MPNPEPIIELIYAFRRSKTMFAAASLGVFDRLHDAAARPEDFEGLNRDAMERLLDGCVALGLLQKDGGLYRNTPMADEYLWRGSSRTLAGYILYSNAALIPMWRHLEDAVREGTNRWEPVFGFPASALFDHYFKTETSKRDFLLGMHGFGQLSSPHVVQAFDLSRFHSMVDLGGGTGHLALAAVEHYPGMKAAVFDLPKAIDFARQFTGDKVELITGDFFADPLPHADLYALGRILHDWTEAKIRRLLPKIHAALPSGGGLLVAEMLLDDDKSGPVDAAMQSLNMLVVAEGKERTLAEYRTLLESEGFTAIEGKRTGVPLDVIIARKP